MSAQYVTRIEVEIVWNDPARGIYHPVVVVSGDVPDSLDRLKLTEHFLRAADNAMTNPSLALPSAAMNAEGFME